MKELDYTWGLVPSLVATYAAYLLLGWYSPGIDSGSHSATVAELVNPILLGLAIPFVSLILRNFFQSCLPLSTFDGLQYTLVALEEAERYFMLGVLSKPQSHGPGDPSVWYLLPSHVFTFALAHSAFHCCEFLVGFAPFGRDYSRFERFAEVLDQHYKLTTEVRKNSTLSNISSIRKAYTRCHVDQEPETSPQTFVIHYGQDKVLEDPVHLDLGTRNSSSYGSTVDEAPELRVLSCEAECVCVSNTYWESGKPKHHPQCHLSKKDKPIPEAQGYMNQHVWDHPNAKTPGPVQVLSPHVVLSGESYVLDLENGSVCYYHDVEMDEDGIDPSYQLIGVPLGQLHFVYPFIWQHSSTLSHLSTALLMSTSRISVQSWVVSEAQKNSTTVWLLYVLFAALLTVRLLRTFLFGKMDLTTYQKLSVVLLVFDIGMFIAGYLCLVV
ncbi:hypothetical protein BABINDRAFT_159977 [Babjeviella inositovora NRRL Y-12698]|uniref:Uncharacterized protein n=1 Tax=Babjeviella inositovora NRRL Y-12698 TaxID=984486 RepID=A0A1E3QVP5_9ASCO|nr:uncharacterized protein BABINDRAFT_159977 [Babjeviella inositovora NRRL Y-12698]ODQ81728.1 hypothetical protein BABINDRAFT_159977 [Babjeviella inositovora NRRL Y-12698]